MACFKLAEDGKIPSCLLRLLESSLLIETSRLLKTVPPPPTSTLISISPNWKTKNEVPGLKMPSIDDDDVYFAASVSYGDIKKKKERLNLWQSIA